MKVKKTRYFTDPRPIAQYVEAAIDFGAEEVRVRALSLEEQQRLGDDVSVLNYEVIIVIEGDAGVVS